MKSATRVLFVIGGLAAVAAAVWLAIGHRGGTAGRTPTPAPPLERVSLDLELGGEAAGPAMHGVSRALIEEIESKLRAALDSPDPEGALIALLSDADAAKAAADVLGDIGMQRAAEALEGVLRKWEQRDAVKSMSQEEFSRAVEEGKLEAMREEARAFLLDRGIAENNLFLIRLRLQGLTPQEQVERISQELDALQANSQRTFRQASRGWRLIGALGTLGLPQGLEALGRLIDAEIKLPALPIPKGQWLRYSLAAKAIVRIGDPGGLPLLEALHARCSKQDSAASLAISAMWWDLQLPTVPETGQPQFLYDTMVSRARPGSDSARYAAGKMGPACLPKMRELALDKALPGADQFADPVEANLPRTEAMSIIAELKDPQGIAILTAIAKDGSEDGSVRQSAAHLLGLFPGSEQAFDAAFETAAAAEAEGNDDTLNGAVMSIWRLAKAHAQQRKRSAPETPANPLTDQQVAFLSHLARDHPSALVRHNAQYGLAELGLGAPPKAKGPYESF